LFWFDLADLNYISALNVKKQSYFRLTVNRNFAEKTFFFVGTLYAKHAGFAESLSTGMSSGFSKKIM
jgi:hypothetical protein